MKMMRHSRHAESMRIFDSLDMLLLVLVLLLLLPLPWPLMFIFPCCFAEVQRCVVVTD